MDVPLTVPTAKKAHLRHFHLSTQPQLGLKLNQTRSWYIYRSARRKNNCRAKRYRCTRHRADLACAVGRISISSIGYDNLVVGRIKYRRGKLNGAGARETTSEPNDIEVPLTVPTMAVP